MHVCTHLYCALETLQPILGRESAGGCALEKILVLGRERQNSPWLSQQQDRDVVPALTPALPPHTAGEMLPEE